MSGLALVLVLALGAQAPAAPATPRFKDYPVPEVYKGKLALPHITPKYHLYRTQIRRQAAEGVNFGGHYTIVVWGCGTGCADTVMVDARDGKLIDLPAQSFMMNPDHCDGLQFRPESRLLQIDGCPDGDDCATHFYEWTGDHWRLIEKRQATLPACAPEQ